MYNTYCTANVHMYFRYRTLYAKLTETSQEDEDEASQGRLQQL